ncbi:hypothetical protein PG994_011632 [Apiospora phragmitis]|uniref:Acyltransferase 3 domain-containing protein n=1 Tax=Apiospora phragmitis TaxID=2905665 RepID=A0ABR1TTJ6_9PEZI
MLETRSKYADVEAREHLVDPQYSMPDGNDAEEGLNSSLLSEKKQSRRVRGHGPDIHDFGVLITWRPIGGTKPATARLALCRLLTRPARALFRDFDCAKCPQYLQALPGGSRTAPRRPLSPTAYLDGVRGVAALVVYVFHWGYLWFPFLRQGWHSSSDSGSDGGGGSADLFLQRPVVRVLHFGRASVTVFFVVSGYVVAVKMLTMIHRGQPDRALDALAGSLFRRPLRLYLPIVAATLVNVALVRGGGGGVFQKDPTGAGVPPRGATLGRQLRHWWAHTVHLVNLFRNIDGRANLYSRPYDRHLWTIPVEFKGSLLVFMLLLAFMKAKRWLHMSVALGFTCWLAQLGDLDMSLFCSGLLLAELSIVLPPAEPLLQRPFTTTFAQCLGKTSYALYLAHGTVNHTVGTRFLNPAWAAWVSAEKVALDLRETGLGDAADAVLYRSWSAYMDAALWGSLVNTFVLFWAADLFCRAVDVPMVKLTWALGSWAWKKK